MFFLLSIILWLTDGPQVVTDETYRPPRKTTLWE